MYLTQNPDRPITLDELEKELGFTRVQASGATTNLINSGRYPNLERVQHGVYRWNSAPAAGTTAEATEMLISVLTRKDDGSMLVRDTEPGGIVYVMRPLDF